MNATLESVRLLVSVDEITAALGAGVLVVLFPEGTSSGGESVLPFKSSLLEPATRQSHSLTAGHLRYDLRDGNASEEVCYWKGYDAPAASDQPVEQSRGAGLGAVHADRTGKHESQRAGTSIALGSLAIEGGRKDPVQTRIDKIRL